MPACPGKLKAGLQEWCFYFNGFSRCTNIKGKPQNFGKVL